MREVRFLNSCVKHSSKVQMHCLNNSASKISKLCPPCRNDGGSFSIVWWSSHCMCFLNKGHWKFVKFQNHTWFRNPDREEQFCRVLDNCELEHFVLDSTKANEFLKS